MRGGPEHFQKSPRMTAKDYISHAQGSIDHSASADVLQDKFKHVFNAAESSSSAHEYADQSDENRDENDYQRNGGHAPGLKQDADSDNHRRGAAAASQRNVSEGGTRAGEDTVDLVPVRCVVGASVSAVRIEHRSKYGDDVLAKIPSEAMRLETLEKEGKDNGYDMKMWKRVMFNVRNCPACNCRPVVVTGVVHLDKCV
jgi:hypothetical protein